MTLEEKVERLDATIHLLTAGLGAIICVTDEIITAARNQGLSMPELESTYLKYRKMLFQKGLEKLEETDPGHAARIQQITDQNCTELPMGYDFES